MSLAGAVCSKIVTGVPPHGQMTEDVPDGRILWHGQQTNESEKVFVIISVVPLSKQIGSHEVILLERDAILFSFS